LGLARPGVVAVAGSGGKTALVEALAAELAGAGERVALCTTTLIYPPPARLCRPAWLWGGEVPAPAEIWAALRPGEVLAVANELNQAGKLTGLTAGQVRVLAASGAWVVAEVDGAARKPLKAWAPHEPAWPGGERLRVVLAGASGLGRPLSLDWVHRPETFAAQSGLTLGQAVTPQALLKVLLGAKGPFRDLPAGMERALVINQTDAVPPRVMEAMTSQLAAQAPAGLRLFRGRLCWGDLEPLA